jgi:hypothetical protein
MDGHFQDSISKAWRASTALSFLVCLVPSLLAFKWRMARSIQCNIAWGGPYISWSGNSLRRNAVVVKVLHATQDCKRILNNVKVLQRSKFTMLITPGNVCWLCKQQSSTDKTYRNIYIFTLGPVHRRAWRADHSAKGCLVVPAKSPQLSRPAGDLVSTSCNKSAPSSSVKTVCLLLCFPFASRDAANAAILGSTVASTRKRTTRVGWSWPKRCILRRPTAGSVSAWRKTLET